MRLFAVLPLCLLALTGCGDAGGPPIEKALATKLANQADAIARAGNTCSARTHARILQRQMIDAINAGSIPPAYQETLQSRVNEIAASLELRCLPTPAPVSAESTQPAPAPVATPTRSRGDDDGDEWEPKRTHGKGKSHGKKDRGKKH
jgi:hypothetical protein